MSYDTDLFSTKKNAGKKKRQRDDTAETPIESSQPVKAPCVECKSYTGLITKHEVMTYANFMRYLDIICCADCGISYYAKHKPPRVSQATCRGCLVLEATLFPEDEVLDPKRKGRKRRCNHVCLGCTAVLSNGVIDWAPFHHEADAQRKKCHKVYHELILGNKKPVAQVPEGSNPL